MKNGIQDSDDLDRNVGYRVQMNARKGLNRVLPLHLLIVPVALVAFIVFAIQSQEPSKPLVMVWPTATPAATATPAPTMVPPTPTVDSRYDKRLNAHVLAYGGLGTGYLGTIETGRPYTVIRTQGTYTLVDVEGSGEVWILTNDLKP